MAEQQGVLCSTTVAAGGYTAGSGLLNVASTSTGSGPLSFPGSGTFTVSISDPTTRIVKTLLRVTGINSATQFATASAAGLDVNCAVGDIVEAVIDSVALNAILTGPAWVALSGLYVNSWTDFGGGYQAGQYTRDGTGRVWVRGLLKAGTLTAGTTILTMPSGFRPPTLIAVTAFGGMTTPPPAYQNAQIDILASGAVVQQATNAGFAAAGPWLFNISYSVN
jgi:hypothetical protein